MPSQATAKRAEAPDVTFLGKGRSAVVFKVVKDGRALARKIFLGSRSANLILTLFYGAPNEYRWCEAAVKAAFYRRKVLARLVRHWFGERLRVADAVGWGVDEHRKAQYLDTELVDGHPARLYSPFLYGVKTEIYDLKDHILPELQRHLVEAGFIGTVWQAGLGHPCAFPNFLCTDHDMEGHQHRWAWIDLESGVPAIASYNLVHLFRYYIPWAIRQRRVLFDDLDIDKLQDYLSRHEEDIRRTMKPKEYDACSRDVAHLIAAHGAWSKETRLTRSLKYFLFRGRITEEEYYYYQWHAGPWYGRVFAFFLRHLPPKIWRRLKERWPAFLKWVNPIRWARFFIGLIASRAFRIELSKKFARHGVRAWVSAGRITPEEAEILEFELIEAEANEQLSDFGVHLALKPLGYVLRVTLIPLLAWLRWISPEAAVFLFVFMGMILRVTYTLARAVEDVFRKRPFPLVAVLVAAIPTVGTLAYPCQMIHSARRGHLVSQFIIYETLSATAQHVPIWGGRDTGWDHFFNRVAHALIIMSD